MGSPPIKPEALDLAGELKHDPQALATEQMTVVTVVLNDAPLERLKRNLQVVRARGGQLYVFADDETRRWQRARQAGESHPRRIRVAEPHPGRDAARAAGVSHGLRKGARVRQAQGF